MFVSTFYYVLYIFTSMVLLYYLWCLALGHTVLGFWTGLDKDYDFGHGYGFACICILVIVETIII